MDEFMSSLGLGTTGRRTIESGPIPVVPTSLVRISGTAGATNQDVFSHSQPIFRSSSSAEGEPVPVSEDPSSTSILRSDLTPMIEWLTRHRARDNEPADTLSSSEEFAAEVPKIPKPYTILTPKDCAKIVGQSVHSIILHSCNDEFRQQCFNKLGVSLNKFADGSTQQWIQF